MVPYRDERGSIARERLSTVTFALDKEARMVRGMTDGWKAARQAAWLILHTERFLFPIYSFDYGTELLELRGTRDSFLFPELKRRVSEALFVDERFTGTSAFRFSRQGSRVEVHFTIHTIYGDMEQVVLWESEHRT